MVKNKEVVNDSEQLPQIFDIVGNLVNFENFGKQKHVKT